MAIITHITTGEDGQKVESSIELMQSPAEFVLERIPDGTPFRCISDGIDITSDVDAMLIVRDATVIECPGSGVLRPVLNLISKVFGFLVPKVKTPSFGSQTSANNALTDRNNEPRPYKRVYDICGTVQTIPSDQMTPVVKFDNGIEIEYGYYYLARGHVYVDPNQVTDGDSRISDIFGSSVKFYAPFESPNNALPFITIGDDFSEPLYVATRSNEVDGVTLLAPNETEVTIGENICSRSGSIVTISAPDADFSRLSVGNGAIMRDAKFGTTPLNGTYPVTALATSSFSFDASSNLLAWQSVPDGSQIDINSKVKPQGGFVTSWVTIRKFKSERIYANIVAPNGFFGTGTNGQDYPILVDCVVEYQLLDDNLSPVGAVIPTQQRIIGQTHDQYGVTFDIPLPTQSYCRVRARRLTDKYFGENQQVEELKFRDLYGIQIDNTPSYGDMTTAHTKRRRTLAALQVKEPQFKSVVTEMVYKYLGGGVFDTVLTPNTQAAQSLIRLMRDPLVGNLDLSVDCMDKILSVQEEIETYFGTDKAGQFCYTFDDEKSTAQDICQTISDAIFCTVYRDNQDIRLFFERPAAGPAMVFTHRSKVGDEKWTRTLHPEGFDCVEYTWTDPKTNIRETITIPEGGGANPNKIDSKGVRNYQQAYWLAHRAYQKDQLQRIGVEFTATAEGIYAVRGQAISVVKGARVATYDGYVVAKNGLTLTLSQEVKFTDGDDHYLQLKRRDGTVESVRVEPGLNARTVLMVSTPSEAIYTGNSAVKTEFSFGNEARHLAQMVIPTQVDPQTDRTVKITGVNYHPDVFLYDGVSTGGGAFSNGFDDGFDT